MTEVPVGYSLKSEDFDEKFQRYSTVYVNEKDMFCLQQSWQEDNVPENLTLNKEDVENIAVNGFAGYYSEDNGVGSLVISNGVYKLMLGGAFTKDELIELAGNLELSDRTIE